jgi:D-sedoheptulose 7-phosphate isomerase
MAKEKLHDSDPPRPYSGKSGEPPLYHAPPARQSFQTMHPLVRQNYDGLARAVADAEAGLDALDRCAGLVAETLGAEGKVLTAGNGGSAADALHLAEELVGRYRENRRALPALSLAADATALTCIGNDFGFDQIFARQIEALGAPGDVLVLFSSSGNSANLLAAHEMARRKGLRTVALLGRGGGKLKGLADLEWIVSSSSGARVQELHGWAIHVILEVVEARLFA